jgi:hypothetical protein
MNSRKNQVIGGENMENLTKRDKHTVRFLKWIRRYSGWWYLICTPNDEHMNLSMMKMLIERLAKEQFYEIIFVLLMVHRNAGFMDDTFKYMLLEMIITGWQGEVKGKKQIIQDITDLLT